MKTTEEYLFEMITEVSEALNTEKVGVLSPFQQLKVINERCAKYALLIDANKIITK